MKLTTQILLASNITALLAWNAATAQQTGTASQKSDQLEEIIVTAERRSTDLQKTAASVDVRDGSDLNKQGRFTLNQILEDVAGVTVGVGATAATDAPGISIVIRGAIPNGGLGLSSVPTTAVYTDGIYSGLGGSYDIDRVELLRGPQGTLYGRSATAGVVSTYTHNPLLGKFGVDGTAEKGNYNLNHETAVVNVPIGEVLAVRAAANYYSRNGFISSKGGYSKMTDGKVKALYQPNDDVSLLVGWAATNGSSYSGGDLLSLTPPVPHSAVIPSKVDTFYIVPGSVGQLAESEARQTWAELNWNLGFGTLTYLPAYRTFYQNSPSLGLGPPGPGGVRGVNAGLALTPTDKFVTHEIRLASAPASTLLWQVGGLYYDNSIASSNNTTNTTLNKLVFNSDTAKDTTDIGVFGEVTLPVATTWRLTGGVRYDKLKVDSTAVYSVGSNPFGPGTSNISTLAILPGDGISKFNNVTFRARVEKDLSPANLLFGMISTGFLPGDVQVSTGSSPFNPVATASRYDQEKLTAYEIGSKNRFLDNTLQLNGGVYYYDYTGYQANILVPGPNPSFEIISTPARMYGGELDAVYQITANDRVSATYAYIHATFVDEPSCPQRASENPPHYCFADLVANKTIPNIAPTTFSVRYDHDFHLPGGSNLSLHTDARYISSYQSQYINPIYVPYGVYSQVENQWIGNLSVDWTAASGKYSVTGYVRNIADNAYKNGTGAFGGSDSTFSVTGTQYDPRTFGVILHAGF